MILAGYLGGEVMGRVLDVDSHWIFPWEFELEKGPLKPFAEELPDTLGCVAYFMTGDMIGSLEPDHRPRPEQLWPPRPAASGKFGKIPDHFESFKGEVKLQERLAWMDTIGIHFSLVNPGGFASLGPLLHDIKRRQQFLSTCNDILVEPLAGHTDRLSPITTIDVTDLDWATGELQRMRALGSRAVTIRAQPVGGLSLGHSHFDRLWATITDLGMVVNLHVGAVPGEFGDWGKIDWDYDSAQGRGGFIRLANCLRHQNAEMLINSLLYGGAFDRHPRLVILMAELWSGWFPNFVRQTEVYSAKAGLWGAWPLPMSGGDYLRRNVRITPLPGLGDWDSIELIKKFPEMVVFSSDLPHTEGNADPINLYGPGLNQLDPALRESFLGENMATVFDRMGDPVIVARSQSTPQ
jgi:predicted TIM-barrel fold metal-dependent hydrolase